MYCSQAKEGFIEQAEADDEKSTGHVGRIEVERVTQASDDAGQHDDNGNISVATTFSPPGESVPLSSRLFRGVPALEACLVDDKAHVTPGAQGEHIRLIQRALVMLGDKSIPTSEYVAGNYGPRTAAAVLDYKKGRSIINFSYQTQADNIVGKMTIASLDRDVLAKQNLPKSP